MFLAFCKPDVFNADVLKPFKLLSLFFDDALKNSCLAFHARVLIRSVVPFTHQVARKRDIEGLGSILFPRCMGIDENDVLWIDTNFGEFIASFDGTSWTSHLMATQSGMHEDITKILADDDNDKWFATDNGATISVLCPVFLYI